MDQNPDDSAHQGRPPDDGAAIIVRSPDIEGDDASSESEPARRPWRAEMARWLLTLNPGRTQDEYAKAVRYFFETSGVPQDLDDISADLLLAYRGALAMRAERGRTSRTARHTTSGEATRFARLWGSASRKRDLPGDGTTSAPPASNRTDPLAPATVNLRLTALRQFLRYASLRSPIGNLTPERVQLALRRLPIERRRPYQILSEEEWPAFLAVAHMPMESTNSPEERPSALRVPNSPVTSPWGRTMAQRQRAKLENDSHQQPVAPEDHLGSSNEAGGDIPPVTVVHRASDGRTGARTAQRDYALVALALATGLRAIELSLLDVGDLTRERRHGRDEWWLTLADEKTKGQRGGRTLPLASELVTILIEYIHSTGRSLASSTDRSTPLFLALAYGRHVEGEGRAGNTTPPSPNTRRLRPEQIRGVINRVETQWLALQNENTAAPDHATEGRRISPHALRHSAAIALLKGSESAGRPPASVEHVRGWLGHFDIRTTQRYLDHLSSREERRKFAMAPKVFPTPPAGDGEAKKPDTAAPETDS